MLSPKHRILLKGKARVEADCWIPVDELDNASDISDSEKDVGGPTGDVVLSQATSASSMTTLAMILIPTILSS
jgi:hypothetical protein